MALLLLGGASALYLSAAELNELDEKARALLVAESLGTAALRERAALSGIAEHELSAHLAGGDAPFDGSLVNMSSAVSAALRGRLATAYPRIAAEGFLIHVNLTHARVVPVEALTSLASPYGGHTPLEVPVFLAVEGGAEVSATAGPGEEADAFVPFFAAGRAPVLLPVAIAARLSAEAGPGGRVERLVGLEALASIRPKGAPPLDEEAALSLVRLALEIELAQQFGASGNASLDARLASLRASNGSFSVEDFFALKQAGEAFLISPMGEALEVEGLAGGVRIAVHDVLFDSLSVKVNWSLAAGQEFGRTLWGGARIDVSGSIVLHVRAVTSVGVFGVGPISVPVSFSARAWTANVAPEIVARPEDLAGLVEDLSINGLEGPAGTTLSTSGVPTNAAGAYDVNATVLRALSASLADREHDRLPPLENASLFRAAFEPATVSYGQVVLRLEAPENLNGSRAEIALDGALVGSAPVEGGQASLALAPSGRHSVTVTVRTPAGAYFGAADAVFSETTTKITVPLVEAPESPLLRLLAMRSVPSGSGEPAGATVLRFASELVGLGAPADGATVGEAASLGEEALLRLEAALSLGALAPRTARLAGDTRDFLKVFTMVLKAADAAYKQLTNESLPLGGLSAAGAAVVFTESPASVATAYLEGKEIAKTTLTPKGAEVRTFISGKTAATLKLRLDQVALAATAITAALTLSSDAVKVRDEIQANDTVGASLAAGRLVGDFASVTLKIAQSVYALAGSQALKTAGVKILGAAISAALLIIELATLYHDHNGDMAAMVEDLLRPRSIAGLLTLPSHVATSVTILATLAGVALGQTVEAGPLGLAIGLFVLAALIVINGHDVASAIFGTIPEREVETVRRAVASNVEPVFLAAAIANSVDGERLAPLVRASAAAAAAGWLEALLSDQAGRSAERLAASDRAWARARLLERLASSARELGYAAAAAAEQIDDFASWAYYQSDGRYGEGYQPIRKVGLGANDTGVGAGVIDYEFRGDLLASDVTGNDSQALDRAGWRALLARVRPADLDAYAFGYALTNTNAIPLSQYEQWSAILARAGERLESAFGGFRDAWSQVLAPA